MAVNEKHRFLFSPFLLSFDDISLIALFYSCIPLFSPFFRLVLLLFTLTLLLLLPDAILEI